MSRLNHRDALLGAIFVLIGAAFILAARDLDIGTPVRMGPGFFPIVLAIVLVLLGLVIGAQSLFTSPEPIGAIPWRGLVLILAAPVVFGITVRGLGLIGAVALAVMISTFASQRANIALAAMLTLGLTVFCVAIFSYGLGLPLPLRGSWLHF